MPPIDLLNAELPQIFNLLKKKKKREKEIKTYLGSAAEQSAIKQGVPVTGRMSTSQWVL